MPRGRRTSLTIRLTPTERQTLVAWQRATTISAGRARRGRIILLVAEGMSITAIAATVGISRRFVYKWVQRFHQAGLAGLADQPGRGRHWREPRQPPLTEQHDVDVGARAPRAAC
jgi:transposase-like protein